MTGSDAHQGEEVQELSTHLTRETGIELSVEGQDTRIDATLRVPRITAGRKFAPT